VPPTLYKSSDVKSDDMQGRNEALNAIVKARRFRDQVHQSRLSADAELQSLGLDVQCIRWSKTRRTSADVEVDLMADPRAFVTPQSSYL